ncbi:anti-sigma factor [Algoriphagus sediminis]|uniref:Anti-sigma factor n=1 Tax=Algoriphagus sediminis TaxID=3057113 RepID=A0ABT7YGD2_9BACT|nr:anti-sigma factor [Algoriphagus sediminis]MDN3205579.1 anti-sigma factor [Algoriphagus sediminis]
MNIQEYIESGKLELFLLGELTERECEEVIAMAKAHPEIQKELDSLEKTMFALDELTGSTPSKGVKDKIFQTLEEDFFNENEAGQAVITPKEDRKVKTLPWKAFAVAASFLAILSFASAIYYASKFYETNQRFTALLQDQQVMADNLDQVRLQNEEANSRLDRLVAGDFQRVEMVGETLPMQTDAKVDVFWDRQAQEVFVAVNNLNSLSADFDYQLWAIGEDGPIGIGLVDPGEKFTLQQMQAVADAGAFAITIEPKGGSESPNLEKLVVLGEVA